MARLRVLFTNDLHGRLTESQAHQLAAMKAEEPDTILLDAGDAVKVGNVGIPLFPEPVWRLMEIAGYDALTLGNREFHITEIGLRAKLKGAPMPVLCANMRSKGCSEPRLAPFVLLKTPSGISVGVIGVTVPMVTERMAARMISAFLFDPPIETVLRLAPSLRANCDVLIALTHIGLKADLELASRVPELDLIIGGHSHEVLHEPRFVDRCPVVQAGSHGKFVGDLRIEMNAGCLE